jgi:hypothetical protein
MRPAKQTRPTTDVVPCSSKSQLRKSADNVTMPSLRKGRQRQRGMSYCLRRRLGGCRISLARLVNHRNVRCTQVRTPLYHPLTPAVTDDIDAHSFQLGLSVAGGGPSTSFAEPSCSTSNAGKVHSVHSPHHHNLQSDSYARPDAGGAIYEHLRYSRVDEANRPGGALQRQELAEEICRWLYNETPVKREVGAKVDWLEKEVKELRDIISHMSREPLEHQTHSGMGSQSLSTALERSLITLALIRPIRFVYCRSNSLIVDCRALVLYIECWSIHFPIPILHFLQRS